MDSDNYQVYFFQDGPMSVKIGSTKTWTSRFDKIHTDNPKAKHLGSIYTRCYKTLEKELHLALCKRSLYRGRGREFFGLSEADVTYLLIEWNSFHLEMIHDANKIIRYISRIRHYFCLFEPYEPLPYSYEKISTEYIKTKDEFYRFIQRHLYYDGYDTCNEEMPKYQFANDDIKKFVDDIIPKIKCYGRKWNIYREGIYNVVITLKEMYYRNPKLALFVVRYYQYPETLDGAKIVILDREYKTLYDKPYNMTEDEVNVFKSEHEGKDVEEQISCISVLKRGLNLEIESKAAKMAKECVRTMNQTRIENGDYCLNEFDYNETLGGYVEEYSGIVIVKDLLKSYFQQHIDFYQQPHIGKQCGYFAIGRLVNGELIPLDDHMKKICIRSRFSLLSTQMVEKMGQQLTLMKHVVTYTEPAKECYMDDISTSLDSEDISL
jgi:hypothetical protein